ncbi:hypothetical protein Q1695_010821 [Nippostrongylus brasiliensis]|nr:hypothetical protein Q1695_010821 [Nippostrongylus brasiliensis]
MTDRGEVNPIDVYDTWMDVCFTVRAGGCCYMIVLTIYLNTLLLARLNYKAIQPRRATITATPVTPGASKEVPMKKGGSRDEGRHVDFHQLQTTQEDPTSLRMERGIEKTLKSAKTSFRLPRAPKGHHVEELDQMERFLAEDDNA